MVLTLVLAESAIELVPNEIAHQKAVLNWARRKEKNPERLILDQNYHYTAMKRLGREQARGRPDIAHVCLLLALGTPLNFNGQLRCIVHTRENKAIMVNPKTRLPRNTDRFVALLEQLYDQRVVPKEGTPLLSLEKASLREIISTENADYVVALTTQGQETSMPKLATDMAGRKKPVLLVGGFPRGHFSNTTLKLANQTCSIDRRSLEAWTVVARAIYDYERAAES